MKHVVLSADGDRMVYAVPNMVAEHLEAYCLAFCDVWLLSSPHAEKYRVCGGLCYCEEDFIAYLNQWLFPKEHSYLIENLGWIEFGEPLPEPYESCPWFNF